MKNRTIFSILFLAFILLFLVSCAEKTNASVINPTNNVTESITTTKTVIPNTSTTTVESTTTIPTKVNPTTLSTITDMPVTSTTKQDVYYDVVFKDYDDTLLDTQRVKEGERPLYSKSNPERINDDNNIYTFAGWNHEIEPVHNNQEYVATYDSFNYSNLVYEYNSEKNEYEASIKDVKNKNIVLPKNLTHNGLLIKFDFMYMYDYFDMYYRGTVEDWCNLEFKNQSYNPMEFCSKFYFLDNHGSYNFMSQTYEPLTEIIIPNTIKNIGTYQFAGLSQIKKLYISEGVENIGDCAFQNCTFLKEIDIPETCKKIGMCAFENTSVQSAVIPKSVGFMGYNAISTQGFIEIYDLAGITDTVPQSISSSLYIIHKSLDEKSVMTTDDDGYVFAYVNGNWCLVDFNGLTNVLSLPNSFAYDNQTINNYKISNTFFQMLYNIYLRNVYNYYVNSIIIPESVVEIDYIGFSPKKLVEIYNISNASVESISSYSKIIHKSLSEQSVIVTDDDGYVFAYVNDVGYLVDYKGTEENLVLPEYFSYNGETISEYIIASGCLFGHYNNISSIEIPRNVKEWYHEPNEIPYGVKIFLDLTMDEYASNFNNVATDIYHDYLIYLLDTNGDVQHNEKKYSLLTKTIISNTSKIKDSLFKGYDSLEDVIISEGVKEIGSWSFAYNKLRNFVIPKSIEHIGTNSFGGSSIENLYYNGSILDWYKIVDDQSNQVCLASNFYIYDDNGNIEYNGKKYKLVTDLEIPDSIIEISGRQIAMKNITSVEISEGTKVIGNNAFNYWQSLQNIIIPDGIIEIGNNAFSECKYLEKVIIPSTVVSLGNNVFDGCNRLYYIKNDSKLNLGQIRLKEKSTGYSLKSSLFEAEPIIVDNFIFKYADERYQLLKYVGKGNTIILPELIINGNEEIKSYKICSFAFYGCESFTNIIVPSSIKTIPLFDFFDNQHGINIYYNGSLTDFIELKVDMSKLGIIKKVYILDVNGDIEFNGNKYSQINDIVIPNTMIQISSSNIISLIYLNNIYYDGLIEDWLNVKIFIQDFMKYANNFYILDMNGDIEFNGKKYSLLTDLVIPNGIVEIGKNQFANFKQLKTVVISDCVEIIGEHSFYNCISLETIDIPSSVINIKNGAFENCKSLTTVKLKEGIERIGEYAFSECQLINEINIPNSIIEISNLTFNHCYLIEKLNYNLKLEDWNNVYSKPQYEYFNDYLKVQCNDGIGYYYITNTYNA